MRKFQQLLVCIAALLSAPFVRPAPGRKDAILVIPQLTRIGDIVATTPLFAAIKHARPQCRILVLVSKKASGILAANPQVELVYYEEYKNNLFALARLLRAAQCSAAFICSGTAFGVALAVLAHIPLRSKLTRRPRPLSEVLTDHLATHPHRFEKGMNVSHFYLTMAQDIGVTVSAAREVFVTAQGEQKAAALLEGSQPVGIMLSAGNRVKEWGDHQFAELIAALAPQPVLIIAGPGDSARAKALGVPVAEGFALSELPSLLKRLRLFISADTGPLHIAAAVGTPVIDILGPVIAGELTPEGPHVHVVGEDPTPSIFAFHPALPRQGSAVSPRTVAQMAQTILQA